MAIAFDATSGSFTLGSSGVFAWSHTCTGSDLALILWFVTTPAELAGTPTYNGVSMTQVATHAQSVGRTLYGYYLNAPAAGANNISIPTSVGANFFAAAASYTGVSQTGQPEANATTGADTTNTLTGSVTTVTNNAWVAMGGGHESGSITAGTGATKRGDDGFAGGVCGTFDSGGVVSPAGIYSQTFTAGGNYYCNMIQFSLAPSGAAAVVTSPFWYARAYDLAGGF